MRRELPYIAVTDEESRLSACKRLRLHRRVESPGYMHPMPLDSVSGVQAFQLSFREASHMQKRSGVPDRISPETFHHGV